MPFKSKEKKKEYMKKYLEKYGQEINKKRRGTRNKYHQEYYYKNQKRKILYSLKWNEEHPERTKENRKKYYEQNIKKIHEKMRKWYVKNKKYVNKKAKEKRKTNPLFKLSQNLRKRTGIAFHEILNINKNCHTFEMIGLSPQETKNYIENKFTKGMTWGNYGKGGWDIDHIIPLSSAKTKEEMIKLCHYTNLQPMWHIENIKKGNKF